MNTKYFGFTVNWREYWGELFAFGASRSAALCILLLLDTEVAPRSKRLSQYRAPLSNLIDEKTRTCTCRQICSSTETSLAFHRSNKPLLLNVTMYLFNSTSFLISWRSRSTDKIRPWMIKGACLLLVVNERLSIKSCTNTNITAYFSYSLRRCFSYCRIVVFLCRFSPSPVWVTFF